MGRILYMAANCDLSPMDTLNSIEHTSPKDIILLLLTSAYH